VTPPPEIRLADRYDAEAVAELIAVAFGPLAVARWLIDDDHSRARLFPGHFRIFVDHALTHGVIHTTTDRRAAALWLPATAPPPADYQARLAATCGPYLGRFQALDAAFDAHHPAAAHHHLALLAVHPARQDTGLGSALLAHHHRQLDAEGTPAYLEASSPRSRQLYLRHGYHDLPDAPFYLPEDGPPMWPMWRPPGQAAGGRP
jgi:GNAT superfamily N-acetyltransferase